MQLLISLAILLVTTNAYPHKRDVSDSTDVTVLHSETNTNLGSETTVDYASSVGPSEPSSVLIRESTPSEPLTTSRPVGADEYLDNVLDYVNDLIRDDNMDPYMAVDSSFLNVHLTGELHGLSSLHRVDNAVRKDSPDGKIVEFTATVGIKELTAKLNWVVRLGFFPIKGKVSSAVDKIITSIQFRVNVDSKVVIVTSFKVKEVGKISTEIESSPIPFVDKITGLVTDTVANVSKNLIAKLVEGRIKALVQDSFNHYVISIPL